MDLPGGSGPERDGREAMDLARSEERLRSIIDALQDGLSVFESVRDTSGQIVDFRSVHANRCAGEFLGRTPAELVGATLLELGPSLRGSLLFDRYVRVVETGEPISYVLRLANPRVTGTFEGQAAKLGDGFVVTYRDVTIAQQAAAVITTSERRLGEILDGQLDACVLLAPVFDASGTVVDYTCRYANERARQELWLPPGDLAGRTMSGLLPHPPRDLHHALAQVVQGGRPRIIDDFNWAPDPGRPPRRFDVRITRVGDGVSCAWRDITDQHQAKQALEESEERFRLAFNEALSGMALMSINPDRPGEFLRVNRAFCDFLGYPQEALIGKTFRDVTHPEDLEEARTALARYINGEVDSYRAERRYLHASGSTVWAAFSVSKVRDSRGAPLYSVCMFEDITARKLAEQDLVFRALHDELTGLPNRALLLDHLEGSLARARRNGSQVGVLFLDLDDFKAINDSHGHMVGDEFLCGVAARIVQSLRGGDTAARIGGDEFVVVCEDLAHPTEAEVVASRVQRALAADMPLRGQLLAAPVSIGIAVSEDDSTPETLLRDADSAMYVAKRRGGRRWEVASAALHQAALRKLTVEAELRQALARDQLCVRYQPIYDLDRQTLVAVEALLRWQHPQRGLLSPAEFLDVAEQRGLIGPIGDLVLDLACSQAIRWQERFGPSAPVVAVNVSTQQLGNQGLSQLVRSTLATSRLLPERLCLEITESQLLAVGTSAVADLNRLAEAGIRLAVDDFGTGFAGFEYLRWLRVHELKIDLSFVAGLDVDRTDTAIVTSVIALGRSLGLTVVAEGIETGEQHEALRRLGCTWGQGWLWRPAIPGDEIDLLLEDSASPGVA